MHTDVAEVSQKYILDARKLCDRPRDLPSAIEFGCYRARSSISMLRVPTVGTHSWKRIQRETVTLVGPMTLKESLQIRNNRLSIPVTVLGIHSHSKTSKCMIMYN